MGILLRVRSEDYGRNAPQPDASLDLGPAIPEATDLDALRVQTVQLLLGQRLLQATTGAALQAPSIPGIAGGAFDANGDAYAVPLDPQGRGSSSADGDAAIQVSAKRMTPEEMAAFDAAHPELAEEINAAADRRPSGLLQPDQERRRIRFQAVPARRAISWPSIVFPVVRQTIGRSTTTWWMVRRRLLWRRLAFWAGR